MNDKIYSVTLADGTTIENLRLNGNNFVSDVEIDKSVFDGNCHSVMISDGETKTVHENMECVQVTQMGEEYWFVLRELSESELKEAKIQASIEYIAMMCDVEL